MSVIDASRAGAARRRGSRPAAGLPRQRVRFALGHSEPNGHLWHREQVTIGCWLLRLRFASPEHRQHRRHGGQVPSLTAPRSAGSGSRPSRASLIGADPPGEVELSGARWCHDPGASRIEVSPALPSRRTTSGSRAPHPRRSRSQTARCRCSVGGSAQGRGHQSIRDQHVLALYEFTALLASLEPPAARAAEAAGRDAWQPAGNERVRTRQRRCDVARGVLFRRKRQAHLRGGPLS